MKVILVILSLLLPFYALAENPFTNFISGFFKNEKNDTPPIILMEEILSLNGSCYEKELNNNFTFGNVTSSVYSKFYKYYEKISYKKPITFKFSPSNSLSRNNNLTIDLKDKPDYCRIKHPLKIKLNDLITLDGNCYRSVFNPDNENEDLSLEFTVSCKIKIWNIRDCFRKSEFNKYNEDYKHRELDCDIPKIERDKFRTKAKSYWLDSVKK